MPSPARRKPEGVVVRHSKACCSHETPSRCDCRPGYQAQVFSSRDRRTIRKTFKTLADARAWRAETQNALNRGTLRAPSRTTFSEAATDWMRAAKAGVVRTRSGDRYKPGALRTYQQALQARVLPRFGEQKISAITRNEIQDLVDELLTEELAPSTVRNAILPMRSIYRRLLARQEVLFNPTLGLSMPAIRQRRERVARPEEAQRLLQALPPEDRATWATALYAGLRRGEIKALRWGDVDFEAGLIRVERGWDPREGPIEPKSNAGKRRVPMTALLRSHLAAHRLRRGGGDEAQLVFGRSNGRALRADTLIERGRRVWCEAGLKPVGLHECRHTYAAFMIAAGVNAKALSSYMGHSTISMTLDRYGHLMPGNEDEAAAMLESYRSARCRRCSLTASRSLSGRRG